MIYNIVDSRKNSYAWGKVWGVVEPTAHDNSIEGATQAQRDEGAPWCESFGPATLNEVLRWAARISHAMTLYVYDQDPMKPVHIMRPQQRPTDPTIAAEDPA